MSNVKRMYRIEQFVMTGAVNDIVLMAAMSNGGKYVSLEYMEQYVKIEKGRYPTLTAGIETTISGNTLLIDRGVENLLAITEVEIIELVDEPFPTLNRYAGTGIADNNNHENLN